MKACSFFLILLFSCPAFSQSPRKLNKQLRAELQVKQQKEDSSENAFLEDQTILEQVRNDLRNKTKNLLYPEDKKLRKTASSITGLITSLKYLGVDTRDVFPNGADFDSYPDYKRFIKPLSEARDRFVKFDIIPSDELDLDKYKLKEQNKQLDLLIRKYESYAQLNLVNFQTQRNYIEKITSFYPRIDSLLLVYQSLNRELETKNDLLLKKMEVARENYRLKGPNGFSRAYHEQFPDVHPVIAEKTASSDFGFESDGIIEGDGAGHSEIPMIVAPKAVETVREPEIFEITDEPASFPGGMEDLKKYFEENLVYPLSAKAQGISGKVYLKFVISNTGEISTIQILKGITDCRACDMEAKRVIQAMPDWIPAKINGKVVNSWFTLPIVFKL
nr:energy transducer TonB [uncultured Fluviicola sp.]